MVSLLECGGGKTFVTLDVANQNRASLFIFGSALPCAADVVPVPAAHTTSIAITRPRPCERRGAAPRALLPPRAADSSRF